MATENKKANNREIGRVLISKNGKALRLEITQDVSLKKGDSFFLNDFLEGLENSVEKGYLTEQKATELAEKLHFVKYTVVRPSEKKA